MVSKYLWYFAYVAGIKSPPSLRAIRGIAVHRAVEVDMTQKIHTYEDIALDEMLDAYDTSWTQETDTGFAVDEGENPGEVKDAGYGLLKVYHAEVAPKIQPIMVEKPIQFDINGQIYSGQIDVAEAVYEPKTKKRRLVVRDTKTTGKSPRPENYTLAMTGYAISQRQETGEKEADVVLDYLVATKTPQYREIRYGGPVTDEQIRKFATVVGTVGESIKAGRFAPNGVVSGACSWCGYQKVCPARL